MRGRCLPEQRLRVLARVFRDGEAARLLLDYRIEDAAPSDEIDAAVGWVFETEVGDLRTTRMLDLMKIDPDMPDSDVTVDYILDNIWIVGSPDDVVTQLQELHEEVGGFGVLLAMGHEWEPREPWLHSMKLLKDEVLPRLP